MNWTPYGGWPIHRDGATAPGGAGGGRVRRAAAVLFQAQTSGSSRSTHALTCGFPLFVALCNPLNYGLRACRRRLRSSWRACRTLKGAQTRTWPVSCPFARIAARSGGTSVDPWKADRVLSKLADVALCRSIQLLVPLARGDAAKDLEIVVLRPWGTEIRSCRMLRQGAVEPQARTLLAGPLRGSERRLDGGSSTRSKIWRSTLQRPTRWRCVARHRVWHPGPETATTLRPSRA